MSDLVLTGVIDGPLPGGLPKAVEIFVRNDVADLSQYGIRSANNGGGTGDAEFTFPAQAAVAGTYLTLATDSDSFTQFFGVAPDFTDGNATSINGDDAIELFQNGEVVDVFGDPNTDGSGQPWEYLDGWAARMDGTGPSPTFDATEWTFSGPNALDNETSNDTAQTPFPRGSYTAGDGGTGADQPTVINEVLGSTDGTDVEYIEIFGQAGASLSGLSLIVVESDDQSDNGAIDARFDFEDGAVIGDNGFFLVGNDLVADQYGVTPNASIPRNFIENSSYTLALVVTDTLSPDAVTGDEDVRDSVGLTDGEAAGSFAFGAPVIGPDGSFLPAGARRVETGVDTDQASDFVQGDFFLGDENTPTAGTGDDTGGEVTFTDVAIHDIQGETDLADGTLVGTEGAADESPLLGANVRVQAIVTQVFQGENGLGGFYIQEENADVDDNALTSEGIFVASDAAVTAGDLVTVEGAVLERGGETAINAGGVTVESSGNALPAAALITFPTATVLQDADGDYVANLEAYEGMRVTVPEALSITEMFQLDRFGTMKLSSDGRLTQFTQDNLPDVEGYTQHLKDIAARSLVLDDGQVGFSSQNPDPIAVPFLGEDGELDGGDVVRMGDTYTDLTGVLSFSEDSASSSEEPEYRIHQPTEGTLTQENPREDAPEVGGSLKVASINVLNYFSTIDTNVGGFNGPNITGPAENQEPRGAEDLSFDGMSEFERQEMKLVSAIDAIAADVLGLVEIENDPQGTTSLQAITSALNAAGGTYDYIAAGPIEGAQGGPVEGDAIKVGFLYNAETVTPTGDFAILDETVDARFQTVDTQRPALAQTFTETATGESFTAAVNHFKSKGSVVNGETAIGDGQGNNNPTRTSAAEALVDWLQGDPTGSGDPDHMILGDLNAYAMEDPIRAILAGQDGEAGTADDYTNLAAAFQDDPTSYVFDGQTGTLDYILANASLAPQIAGADIWNVNSPEPDALDYNLNFGRDGTLYTDDAYRSSDHDPVVAGLNLGQDTPVEPFTLELLHVADQEASSDAVTNAPNLSAVLNALEAQDLGDDGLADNTLRLSSGDAFIPGVFFSASEAVFGSAGIADIQIQNELGFRAIALGNHEFDLGTGPLAALIDGSASGDFSALSTSDLAGMDFTGTAFPYLSANLDFSGDENLAPLVVEGGQAPQGNVVTSSVVTEVNGEPIGVVGATTPTLGQISSPGGVVARPDWAGTNPTDAELAALAAEIQTEVDALLDANPGLNKVILLSHMQQISIEQSLAQRLENVDIIVAGGSNTRLFDDNDRARAGDSDQGQYPQFYDNAGGSQTALVNTDGSYKYVGRLAIDFDAEGRIIPESYDADVSGAYATDAEGVAALGAADMVDPEVQAIADAIEEQIIATQGNVFGQSDVYLNGNRSGTGGPNDPDGVRTQETNLGNLTADANLAAAQAFDDTVMVSIKNGGGIRASIGETVVPPGGSAFVRQPNGQIVDSDGNIIKPEGGISQTDIETTLAFNNGLSLITLTVEQLVATLEHGVSALPDVAGQFPQIAGIQFSFDDDRDAGNRIVSAAITDGDGNDRMVLVRDGEIVGDGSAQVRVATLGFLADGGDGYSALAEGTDRVDLTDLDGDGAADNTLTGTATFAADGSEQDALAEYLAANFATDDTAFSMEDDGPANDLRIQNLDHRDDTVIDAPAITPIIGGDGNDRLVGTDGDDILVSGGGRFDTMTGGAGADVFVFDEAALNGTRERDVITDFEAGIDTIALTAGIEVAQIREAGDNLVIYLDNPDGPEDAIYVRGDGLSADTIDIQTDYSGLGL